MVGRRSTFDNPGHTIARKLARGRVSVDQVRTATQLSAQNRKISQPRSQRLRHALRRGWSCSNHKQPLRLVLHALASSSKLAHRRRTARDALPPAGASGNQVAEEDDSSCALQFLEEEDKIRSKQLLCAANSATCSAGCEARDEDRPAGNLESASKLQLTLSITAGPHHEPTQPLSPIATQHLTLPPLSNT